MKKFLLLLVILPILSCNLGLTDGSDLVGLWKATQNNFKVIGKDLRFNSNGYGNNDLDKDVLKTNDGIHHEYFSWESENTNIYKTLILKNYNYFMGLDSSIGTDKYYYYFNATKDKLYIRNVTLLDLAENWYSYDKW